MEYVGRICLGRAPHMEYKYSFSKGAKYVDKALEYLRRLAREADSSSVRAVANDCEFVCEAMRMLRTRYAPSGKGLPPPAIRPEGTSNTLGALRTLSRVVKDAARVETSFCASSMRVTATC